MRRITNIYVGDFETTVYDGQEFTEVWASALVKLNSEDVVVHHSLDETFDYLKSLNKSVIIYYHNLKFDGSFWVDYLIRKKNFKQAYSGDIEHNNIKFLENKDMPNNSFKYVISNMGMWYTITIKVGGKIIELRDSLKLLPFSVKEIGKAFDTKHKKLDMEYKGFRYAGCEITDEELKYIKNDVLVVKEALEILIAEGHNKLTIGACCLDEFKTLYGKELYPYLFPNLYDYLLNDYGSNNADEYIRKSYRGGWCYLVSGKEGIHTDGITADVNSLYPSVMHSKSGNKYPVGNPTFWKGKYIPREALDGDKYYFIRIKTRFKLKPGYLPTIQIKNNILYKPTEYLETSDIYSKELGRYVSAFYDERGNYHDTRIEMTLTCTDYDIIRKHYYLDDFEILDGCYFDAHVGIFDEYINKYAEIKKTSKGAKRTLAKLFLNNLYGKMASSDTSNFKVIYQDEDEKICFYTQQANEKIPGYIAIGSAITSYARAFTIRAAQSNYYGKENRGFIYADTDSIHCDIPIENVKNIEIDDNEFLCWKIESSWDEAIFLRQKTYIEHITKENLEEIDKPYYSIKCAGMPSKCKELFCYSLGENNFTDEDINKLSEEEKKFISVKRELSDFKYGLKIPGKLLPKRINGGILLTDTTYELRY